MTTMAPEAPQAPGVYQVAEDDWGVVPFTLGPTWVKDPEWDKYTEFERLGLEEANLRDPEGYILPEFTLGWQAIHWVEENLLADEVDEHDKPLPFSLTNEQIRFILWFYAIDGGEYDEDGNEMVEGGRFLYREVVLQRLKGWGKDPLAAVISAIEFVGPCRFAGWATEDLPEHGIEAGDPFAKPHPRAWIQIAAVSLVQTRNTMLLFQGLFTDACKAEHGIDIGREFIYAYGGKKQIQAVTSSPRALEGNRPTLVIKNETHHWIKTNDGLEMADAIERNATKAKGAAARTLSITNAPEPSIESVALNERAAYEEEEAGTAIKTGMLYDSLEAPTDARLKPKLGDDEEEMPSEEVERLTRRYLQRVLESVRGDAWWLDIQSLTNSILNRRNRASRSRRFWFNQIVASEDAWLDPAAIDVAISEMAKQNRERGRQDARGILEAGWLVAANEPIVMFFDGSKSDDSTALVGCRLRDGYIFTIGVWNAPTQKDRAKVWLAPREAVSNRVAEAFKRFNIVAFWADPSHTKEDEDGSRYWDGYIDKWFQDHRYKPGTTEDQLNPKYWSIKGGHRKHAIMFDMAGPDQQKLFVAAAEEFVESMESINDIEEFEPTFEIDGHPSLVQQLKNAIRNPGQWGTSLMKENRESKKKIDLAVAAVGARMLRRVVLNTGLEEEEEEKPGEVWGNW